MQISNSKSPEFIWSPPQHKNSMDFFSSSQNDMHKYFYPVERNEDVFEVVKSSNIQNAWIYLRTWKQLIKKETRGLTFSVRPLIRPDLDLNQFRSIFNW